MGELEEVLYPLLHYHIRFPDPPLNPVIRDLGECRVGASIRVGGGFVQLFWLRVTDSYVKITVSVSGATKGHAKHAGDNRELYFRQDHPHAVLILECENTEVAREYLGTLPLVREGLLAFDLILLKPYLCFSMIFTSRRKVCLHIEPRIYYQESTFKLRLLPPVDWRLPVLTSLYLG